ncbi:hypothetical protein SAMN05428988_4498 [Chitinophaga sp. YR573]|uniref:hypothetical protein n=1 Tax=Chitinophaga sp. YR573 TaxID=1881040 RepID=UPI0008CE0256|nr:hypothetical protein [Chitinophaga sp. YR573]SEW36455.1 hypothetical protein SAMN05428988_4498 [Chitinophaga sp. YR573]
MKRVKFPLSRSKSAILLMFVAAGISMAIPACKKDESTAPAVSQEDASTMVNESLFSTEGNGLQFQTDNAVSVAANYDGARQGAKITSEDCGIKKENSYVVKSEPNTSGLSYSYNILWNWTLTCKESEPVSFAMATTANISYTTKKVSVVDSSVAAFTVSGLQSDSAYLLINQTYNHTGSYTITSGDTVSTYHNTISYKSTDVKVSKATRMIVSGTAEVTISGTNAKGQVFSYSGTITYQGSYKAIFAIKGGSSFNLTWTGRQ